MCFFKRVLFKLSQCDAGLRLQKPQPFTAPPHLSLGGATQAELAAQAPQHNVIAWMSHALGESAAQALVSVGARRVSDHSAGYLHHWEF